jgi:hypothetical protein
MTHSPTIDLLQQALALHRRGAVTEAATRAAPRCCTLIGQCRCSFTSRHTPPFSADGTFGDFPGYAIAKKCTHAISSNSEDLLCKHLIRR